MSAPSRDLRHSGNLVRSIADVSQSCAKIGDNVLPMTHWHFRPAALAHELSRPRIINHHGHETESHRFKDRASAKLADAGECEDLRLTHQLLQVLMVNPTMQRHPFL